MGATFSPYVGTERRSLCNSQVPQFEKVAFDPATPVGVPVPVETTFGHHLLIVDEREGLDEEKEESKKEK